MAIVASAAVDAAGFGFVVPPEPNTFWTTSLTLAGITIALSEGVRRLDPALEVQITPGVVGYGHHRSWLLHRDAATNLPRCTAPDGLFTAHTSS